ncbi:MAG: tetraacyldisaccharide 4'-kinase [Desulfuromonadaceae bacterium]|nr:tetraacyldisaccharide 4'-kinase [Desulfuromonadaceae bacterium]MDD5104904.1 tetraacyldisaccharide 4'-kinase [Desulfuromonadaceae bacterium]
MNRSYQTYWRELASGVRTGTADSLVLLLLAPLARLYSIVLQLRALMFTFGILKKRRLSRPVVSVGNLTVGGTGKTPVTAFIARYLLAQGLKVAVLSRGYGGALEGQTLIVSDGSTIMMSARECGDEPYLLATTVPGLIVVIGTDRYAAGLMALQQLEPDVFILDDGFQHQRLHRDLNILLLDFSHPFGSGLTIPAGLLREPSAAVRRADLVIFTRSPEGATISGTAQGTPACVSSHTIIDFLPLDEGAPVPLSRCLGHNMLAFAGIADPDSFFEGLRAKGLNLVHTINFPDHVTYTQEQYEQISRAMREKGAEFLVTTEKDGVKLMGFPQEWVGQTLLARLEITFEKPDIVHKKLDELF